MTRSNQLRQAITNYYEVRLKDSEKSEAVGYNVGWNHFAPLMMTRFKTFSIEKGAEPVSLEALKNDQEYKQFLQVTREFKLFDIWKLQVLRKAAQELKQKIESELK